MSDVVEIARKAIEIEIESLKELLARLDEQFERAVEYVLSCRGKVIFTGMGKSGHIGRKLAATFASTGTPAFFVHPAEGVHGDSGMITKDDLVIAISNSGETAELLGLLAVVRTIGAPVIAMTGRRDSTLARNAVAALDIGVRREADPLNLAPTASAAATLAMGDALAVAVMTKKGFTKEDFGRFHPGGALGQQLRGAS